MASALDDAAWQEPPRHPDREAMLAPSTQIVADREAYLGQGRHDVGRRISAHQVELFISADVAGSLQRELMQHQPEYIAVHDVGTSASLRLLASVASAAGGRVQRLSIRRQGHGVALTVLQFVEVPLADGSAVRVYATDISADAQTRAQVARVLLGFSRLGVLLVGELMPHAITGQLFPLHEAMQRGPWPNRDQLMVPLGSSTAVAAPAAQLAGQSQVAVHVTPHASKPQQAWNYISGAWNRLNGGAQSRRAMPTDMAQAMPHPRVPDSEAPTEHMALAAAAPAPASARNAAVALGVNWPAYIERCSAIRGSVSCCVFEIESMKVLARAGGPPAAGPLAHEGALLLARMSEASRALGLGPAHAEATISVAGHHLLLRAVPGHPGAAVHLVLLASAGNLTLARMQLERLEVPR